MRLVFQRSWRALGMILRSRFLSNVSIYVVGNMVQQAAALLLVPLYTRYLLPEEYAIWGTLVGFVGILLILIDLGVTRAIPRYYYDYFERPERVKSYLTVNFLFCLMVGGGIIAVLYLVGQPLWPWLTNGKIPFAPYGPIVLVTAYAQKLNQFVTSLYRAKQRAASFVAATLGQFFIQICCSIYFVVVMELGALGPLLGNLAGACVGSLVLSYLFIKEFFSPRLIWQDLRDSISFGLPLTPHKLASWVRNVADRFILIRFVSMTSLGIYNLGHSGGMVMSLLVGSIDLAYTPYYYRLMKTRDDPKQIIVPLASFYVAVMGGICLVGALFANEVLHLLVPPAYFQAAVVVPLVLNAYLFHGYYALVGKPLFYNKRTGVIPWLTGVPTLLSIGLNFLLVPVWGIMAALWVTLFTFLLILIGIYIVSQRMDPTGYPLRPILLVNSFILGGSLLATYVFPLEISVLMIAFKSLLLGVYGLIAWRLLIIPYLPVYRSVLFPKQAELVSTP